MAACPKWLLPTRTPASEAERTTQTLCCPNWVHKQLGWQLQDV